MSLLSWLLKRFGPGLVEAAVEEVEAQLEPEEEPVPLTHRSVEHQQEQIRSASKPACSPRDCATCGTYHGGLSCPVTSPRAIVPRPCIVPPPRPPRKRQ